MAREKVIILQISSIKQFRNTVSIKVIKGYATKKHNLL